MRLESLDGRVMPDANPASPPDDTPPPQTGDPAAQSSISVWGYLVSDDGTADFGLYEVTTTGQLASATDFTSVYDPLTGSVTAATASAGGPLTQIGLPANPQAGYIYAFDSASGTWAGVPVPSAGVFVSPSAGNTVTPITDSNGAVQYWTVHPQDTAVVSAEAAVPASLVAQQNQDPNAKPVGSIQIGPGGKVTLPDGTVIDLPNGGTVTINPGGSMTIDGPGGTVTTPGGAKSGIAPGGVTAPIGPNSGTITFPGGYTQPLPTTPPSQQPPPPPRPAPPPPTWPPSHPLDPLFPGSRPDGTPNTIRPIYRGAYGILTDQYGIQTWVVASWPAPA